MKPTTFRASLVKAGLAASLLLAASSGAYAQSAVTLTAGPQSTTLPDGQTVPMWGYACGAISGTGVSCSSMNGAAQVGGAAWQPPLITVPFGQPLTITLGNQLAVPTSIVIVGQVGGGLGNASARTTTPSPMHRAQGPTWAASGEADPSIDCSVNPN